MVGMRFTPKFGRPLDFSRPLRIAWLVRPSEPYRFVELAKPTRKNLPCRTYLEPSQLAVCVESDHVREHREEHQKNARSFASITAVDKEQEQ